MELLYLTILDPKLSYFENCVDPDQLASEKPADQVHTVFTLLVSTS